VPPSPECELKVGLSSCAAYHNRVIQVAGVSKSFDGGKSFAVRDVTLHDANH